MLIHEEIVLLPLRGMEDTADRIKEYLYSISSRTITNIVNVSLMRFSSGDGKAVLEESVRGKDVYILVDVGNYAQNYKLQGECNHMSPDDHFMDLIRTISAIGGKAARVNVISPLMYSARQDRRVNRESLDCAVALQQLYNIGVSNIMAFDVHDDRVQNAVPFIGFDKLMPTYQTIKTLCREFDDLRFNEDSLVMVSPDFGAMGRNHLFSNELGLDLGVFYKRRSTSDFEDGKYAVEVHKYIGPDIKGKDVLVIDDIISSGETMLDVVRSADRMGARRVFVVVTFGFFTGGIEQFQKVYDEGALTAIFVTNASYIRDEVRDAPWFREINIMKYISYYIYCVNRGESIAKILDPSKKINHLLKAKGFRD